MYASRSFVLLLLSICSIDYAFGCYIVTQNGTELVGTNETDRVASNVTVKSGSNIFDCFGMEFEIQKVQISWNPSKNLSSPEYFNVTVQSNDTNFFAKKTIPGHRTTASFGVLITSTRRYNVTIEAKYNASIETDEHLKAFTTFVVEKERPCLEIDPYLWIGICTFIIIVSYALAYKCHVELDEPIKETKKSQYEKNLSEGNNLLPNDLTEKKDGDAIKNDADKDNLMV